MTRSRFVMLMPLLWFSVATARTQAPGVPSAETQRATGTLEQHLSAALQHYVHLEWDLAIEEFTAALRIDPSHTAALLGRGMAYKGKGETEKAVRDFRAVINSNPRSNDAFNAHLILQQILLEKGDLPGALAEVDQAVAIRPNNGIVRGTRGKLKEAKGDLDGALADLDKAISLEPRYSIAYDYRGVVRSKKGDFDGAINDFTKALELNVRQPSFIVHRGDTKRAKGDFDGALADYNMALNWDNAYTEGHIRRGLLKLALGRDDEAQADFDYAVSLDPSLKQSIRKAIDEEKAKKGHPR